MAGGYNGDGVSDKSKKRDIEGGKERTVGWGEVR